MSTSAVTIGIDLGTTYSCVAVLRDDEVQVIPNDLGNRLTPSCVAFHDDDVLVGDSAKNLAARGVPGVVYDTKRMIGRKFSDKSIQEDRLHWPFVVAASQDDDISIEVVHKGEVLHLFPEQISAHVLMYLKGCAERFLGRAVRNAVITVPAYFNDAQRSRTKVAATIAGLDALRIVNEPTAAALCYGLGLGAGGAVPDDKALNVLVFDFGGGTFDVSVITADGGSFAVRSTAGDTHLGGQDIDTNLLRHVVTDLKDRHQVDLPSHPRQLARVRLACESVKRSLSYRTSEELAMDDILPSGDEYTLTISRAKLEELNAKVFTGCLAVVKAALRDAKMRPEDIDEVILVGGSSRIPRVQQDLRRLFKGKSLCSSVHPDEAVALGAAIQAGILSDDPAQQSERTAGVVLMDVTPLSIGVDVDEGRFDSLIPRNTTIPYKATKEYSTVEDYQEDVDIVVYEGERPLTKHNHKLGQFTLEGITRAKQGVPTINVTLSIDANGLLTVTASEAVAKKTRSLVVRCADGLSDAQVQVMIEVAKKYNGADALELAVANAKVTLEAAFVALHAAVDAMPRAPSQKLQRRLAILPHGEEWLSQQLPRYTVPDGIAAKVEKILQLIHKVQQRVQKESERGRAERKRLRSASTPRTEEEEGSASDEEDAE